MGGKRPPMQGTHHANAALLGMVQTKAALADGVVLDDDAHHAA